MADIQDRDRLHVQDDSPETPHPGYETPAENAAEDYAAVRVHVTNPVATTTGATQFGSYATIVIPPSANGVPSIAQVLPRDPLRQYAYLQPVDEPVVISTQAEQAGSAANIAAALPAGAYLPAGAWTPPVRHNEPVYACNTSATEACRVVVLAERGEIAA